MQNFKQITTDEYGYFNFVSYTKFVNAHSLRDAAVIWLKRILKMPENSPVFLEDGKLNTKLTLQNWVNDYGITVFDNMDEPTNCTTVSVDEVISHLINTFGFLTVNRTSINNSLFNQILNEVAIDWKINDYQHTTA